MKLRIYILLILTCFAISSFAQEGGDETVVKRLGKNVKETLDSIKIKDRVKNTTSSVVISSLEAKAKRQEMKGDLEDATLIYLRVVNKYRESSDSLGVARTYNKIAALYVKRGNPQAAKAYFSLASRASGEEVDPGLVGFSPEITPDTGTEGQDPISPKSSSEDTTPMESNEPDRSSGSINPPPRRPRNPNAYEKILSQLHAEKDSADILRLMIEDQEKNILILQQEKEIEQAAREREKRFRWTLIGGVIIALFLAGLLYRQFLIKRKAHIQTEKALQDLATAHEQLKTTQTQLVDAEKMASLGLLTAGIAHEINNPINFISGNIEPLKQDITDIFAILQKHPEILEKEKELSYLKEEVVELLGGMEEGAHRTTEIVSGLRDFSRLDTDDLQQFDLQKGIESTLSLLRNELSDRIEVEKSYASLPLVEGFPGKINQVFMNVLTNAIQAISEKGTIGIITSYDAAQQQVQISILDNGKGMSQEIIAKAFDPFFTTKEVGEGTGLGLAISKGIIDQHGGSIEIKSEENVGTEVVIKIPEKFEQDSSAAASQPTS